MANRKTKVEHGTMDVSHLPGRPQRKAYTRKPLDFTSVKSLSARIEAIDRRIANAMKLKTERNRLAGKLIALLKVK